MLKLPSSSKLFHTSVVFSALCATKGHVQANAVDDQIGVVERERSVAARGPGLWGAVVKQGIKTFQTVRSLRIMSCTAQTGVPALRPF